jgi:hypothetical protein
LRRYPRNYEVEEYFKAGRRNGLERSDTQYNYSINDDNGRSS